MRQDDPTWPVSKQFHIERQENETLKLIARDRGMTLTQLMHRMVEREIEEFESRSS